VIELVLVRHGEPHWEPGGRAVDQPQLTELGHRQARCVADVLGGESFDAVYTSPLQRAAETAAPVIDALAADPIVQPWLAELRLPALEGLTSKQVEDFFSRARARDLEDHWNGMQGDGVEGGESFRHFYERVSSGIEGLLLGEHRMGLHQNTGHRVWNVPEQTRQRLLVVAHAGTNAVILSHLLGIDPVPWAYMRFESAWAGITRLHTQPMASGFIWKLVVFSDTAHLSGLPDRSPPDPAPAVGSG